MRGGGEEVELRDRVVREGGDIIISIDDREIIQFEDLLAYLVTDTEVGQEVTVTIYRDGEFFEVPVTLAPRPGS